jgi:hypothetical protein
MKVRKPKPIRKPGDTLTPEEAKIARRGEAQLKRGESKPWRTIKKCATALTISKEAEEQLFKFPRKVRDRLGHAIDELEAEDDSRRNNIKALQGPQ